ncbi:DinB family protein [Chitinophaga cymbidii]|uniref:Protein DinB n=1 Tax=Chitinophaga cymbidii TaxID=1096750 RepID=A0A512RJX7_9BACT|nr:DinB family protein [Chitinophaga cymbidii]GEP95985.1 protein DinB [Chitinophaga cymbidii]
MKDLLLRYAMYNIWANQRMLTLLNGLREEQLDKDLGSSYPTLRKTIYHIWDGESIWYQRLQLASPVLVPTQSFTGDWEEFTHLFTRQSEQLKDLVATASDVKLAHTIEYHHPQKGICKSAVAHSILSVFNHSTFHRGQLVTMLRQTGMHKIPATDFIEYTRSRK